MTLYSIPSFAFKSAFTACGLALPPLAFIDLADEPAEHRRLRPRLLGLFRIGGDHLVHDLLDRAGVGDLPQPALLHDVARVAALREHDLEDILGDLAGDLSSLLQIEELRRAAGQKPATPQCLSRFGSARPTAR